MRNHLAITQRYGEAKVTEDMQAEFGSELVGLWLGDDIVFNESNIATSWPGRIGNTFTQESVTHNFTKTTYLGRTGLASTPLQSQRFVCSTVTTRELWVLASSSSASPTDYQALITTWDTVTGAGSVGRFLQATANTNQWYSAIDTDRWMDGVTTTTFDTNMHVYGAYIQPVSQRPINRIILGNDEGASTTRSWGGTILGVVALANQTTSPKRTIGNNLLRRYLSGSWNQFVLDLQSNLPANSSIWIGDDLVISSGEVLSWPARIGNTLNNAFANKFNTSNINGRLALDTNEIGANSRSLFEASTTAPKSLICVTIPSANLTGNKQLLSSSTANNGLVRLDGGTTWYAAPGWTFYRNGLVDNTAPVNEPCVLEAENASNTTTGVSVGGYNAAGSWYPWDGPIGCVISSPSTLTSQQRTSLVTILRRYYKF